MLEVVDLLEQNDFTVYIVSGTDCFIVRGLVSASPLHIPSNQIIGSDDSLVATDDHRNTIRKNRQKKRR